jgi:hypothetical protein
MNGTHTIVDARMQQTESSRNLSSSPNRPDRPRVDSAFLAERGETQPPNPFIHARDMPKVALL